MQREDEKLIYEWSERKKNGTNIRNEKNHRAVRKNTLHAEEIGNACVVTRVV